MTDFLMYTALVIAVMFAMFGVWVSNNQDVAERLMYKFRKKRMRDDDGDDDFDDDEEQAGKGRRSKKRLDLDAAGSTYNFLEFDNIHKGMITFKKDPDYFVMGLGIQGVNVNMYTDVEKLSLKNGFINILNTLKEETQFLVQSRYVDLSDNFSHFRPIIEESKREVERLQQRLRDEGNDLVREKISQQIARTKARNGYAQHIVDFFDFYIKQSKCISINVYMLINYRYIPKNNFSFNKERVIQEAYGTLANRAKLFQEQFNAIGLKAEILNSIEMADIMYSSLAKKESSYMRLEDALKNGLLDTAIQDMDADSRTDVGEIKYKDNYPYPHEDNINTLG